jgi:hypothetical protein
MRTRSSPTMSIHKALIQKHDTYLVCLSHGPFTKQCSTLPHTLWTEISALPPSAAWSISSCTATDDGEEIAEAIKAGTTIAVSDGSFQDGKGTSAWVIEGNTSNNQISGSNFTPGLSTQQNSYRSVLSGLYGITMMLLTLCKLHQIQSGSIIIACDNISALDNAMQHDHPPSLSQAEYDFI